MLGQRKFTLHSGRTDDGRRRCPERFRESSSRHRRHRAGVEYLEDRRLLSAITEFPIPMPNTFPETLTVGPDGNLWFPENGYSGTSEIGRITPSGVITEFPLPTSGLTACTLTVGPDGNLWFPENGFPGLFGYVGVQAQIGRIAPSGVLTEFPLPTTEAGLLTVGPDGNIWFAEGGQIGRISPSGVLTAFPLPTAGLGTYTLTVGPDGDLWFPETGSDGTTSQIGRITPAGVVTEFPLPTAGYFLETLTVGPDGNLWFGGDTVNNEEQGEIGRITPSGAITELPSPITAPREVYTALTVGPDGNLWFPEESSIGEFNPSPPRVTEVDVVAHSGARVTSIVLDFNEALDPGTAGQRRFYSLDSCVMKRHMLVFSKSVKISKVLYDGDAQQVTLKLAKPHKGKIEVTVRAGLIAADGVSSFDDFTEVVR